MGDVPPVSGTDLPVVSSPHKEPGLDADQTPQLPQEGNYPLEQHPQQFQNVQQQYQQQPPPFNAHYDMAQPQVSARPGPYNMAALANALPQGNYRQAPFNPAQMRYNPTVSSPNMHGQNQHQHLPPYNGQSPMGHIPNQSYYMQQHPQQQMAQFYGSPISPSQPQANMQPRPNIPYYGNQVMAGQQSHPTMAYYYQMPQYAPQGHPQRQAMPGPYLPGVGPQQDFRLVQQQMGDTSGESAPFSPSTQPDSRRSPSDSQSSVVRGPPRKPKQSGHAIWIGNLPSQTDLMSLVHHVCKEAEGLESLFLISKSNCAFANYRDEVTCLAAQQKLHESKFQSVRLVSRLRKNTVEGASGVTAPTGPSATTTQHQTIAAEGKENINPETIEVQSNKSEAEDPMTTSGLEVKAPVVVDAAQKDKFFILKSLTLEDLELSVRTGIWATQSHNEETLNHSFKAAENVYLVFSANKSGEYFGYARMLSTINEDPAAAIEFAPKVHSVSDVDLPKEIPTEANESTPKGRIIDDSARGTIFWEVIHEDGVDGLETDEAPPVAMDQDDASSGPDVSAENKAWGKPFKLEWLCTTRLPFYRCRGLRNPWNSNREVKIARDGTELEPSVGRRLIGLFNRNHNSPIPRGPMMGMGQMMPQQMAIGYPPPPYA